MNCWKKYSAAMLYNFINYRNMAGQTDDRGRPRVVIAMVGAVCGKMDGGLYQPQSVISWMSHSYINNG